MKRFPLIASSALLICLATACGGSADKAENAAGASDAATTEVAGNNDAAENTPVTIIKADGQIPPADGKLIVMDFNATWCGPCRQFAPNFESVAGKYSGQAAFYSIDVDENPSLAAQYNIQGIPTIVYIQPDGTVSSSVGYMDEAEFDAAVASRLK